MKYVSIMCCVSFSLAQHTKWWHLVFFISGHWCLYLAHFVTNQDPGLQVVQVIQVMYEPAYVRWCMWMGNQNQVLWMTTTTWFYRRLTSRPCPLPTGPFHIAPPIYHHSAWEKPLILQGVCNIFFKKCFTSEHWNGVISTKICTKDRTEVIPNGHCKK